jgi:PKD repeat protein
MTGDRGVMPVVGVVVLVGIAAIGGVTLLVVGSDFQESTEDRIADERVEKSFMQLDARIADVSSGEPTRRTVDFDLPDSAASEAAIRRESAGTIVFNRTNATTTNTIAVKEVGSIVYERDGTQYTYQAGAVWRGTGEGARLVSAPQFSYEFSDRDGRARPTLNFRIAELDGAERLESEPVSVEHKRTVAPFNNVSAVEDEVVTMSITSEFYAGWGSYFEQRYPQRTAVDYDHSSDTVTVEFGQHDVDGDFGTGIVAEGDVEINNPSITLDTEIEASGSVSDVTQVTCSLGSGADCVEEGVLSATLEPLDDAIEQQTKNLAEACSGGTAADADLTCLDDLSDETLDGGNTYYVSGDTQIDGDDTVVDLSGGNVTVFSDGDIGIRQGSITTRNGDSAGTGANCCHLRLYTNGTDMALADQGTLQTNDGADPGDATRFQIYGTSDFQLTATNVQAAGVAGVGEGPEAAIYAPGPASNETNDAIGLVSSLTSLVCDQSVDICLGPGSGEWHGSIVAGPVSFEQNAEFSYDDDLDAVDPTLSGTVPPPVTFLQVSVHEVCVGTDTVDCDGDDSDATSGPSVTVDAPGGGTTVDEGETVDLNSTVSDPDGTVTNVTWSATSGTVNGPDAENTTYTAPSVGSDTDVTIEVTAEDDDGATASESVTVTVVDDESPTATFTYSPSSPGAGDPVGFDATNSSDPDGGSLSYSWEFGDGTTASGVAPGHTYSSAGTYTVTLTVEDDEGDTDTATRTVTVPSNSPPSVTIDTPSGGTTVDEGETVDLSSTISDPDGTVTSVTWSATSGTVNGPDAENTTYTAPDVVTNCETTIEITVEDDDGATASESVTVFVKDTTLPVSVSPPLPSCTSELA